ncbi:Saccharopine dehydrogenase-domain-containing protein [Cyathus striatus]|nr:Saccharopine dehydrogenase-domain-containing protein [Cyathus striatus]
MSLLQVVVMGVFVHEVLKHDTVQEVVLCDIDEAVIRVSKSTSHACPPSPPPRSAYTSATASNPVGPAESLFQKPYVQLLHNALTPWGHISTQGECMWIHLPLVHRLRKMTSQIFSEYEYAYTTIPTYPFGKIGFMVCAKAPGRDLLIPVREAQGTRYYNKEIHKSTFVFPEFVRALLEGKVLKPKFGKEALAPAAEYVVRDPFNELTIVCCTLRGAEALAEGLSSTTGISLNVNDAETLGKAVAEYDLTISLIPYTYHALVIKPAIKSKTHVVTMSYVSPTMRELDEEAKKAGIVVINEIGLDPGFDHLYVVKAIDEAHAKRGIKKFLSYCGGLPASECAGYPLGYKFSWSSRGVLLALLNSAAYLSEGKR